MSIFDPILTNAEILINGYYPNDDDYRYYLMSLVIRDSINEKKAKKLAKQLEADLRRAQVELERAALEIQEENAKAERESDAQHFLNFYLGLNGFSKKSLKEKLIDRGFTEKESQHAIDQCGADWKKQALKSTKWKVERYDFLIPSIRDFLQSEGFTEEEIEYAIEHCGTDPLDQVAKKAKEINEKEHCSRMAVEYMLLQYGFSKEEVSSGTERAGILWKNNAFYQAEKLIEEKPYSRKKLIEALMERGFTKTEAEYGTDLAENHWERVAAKVLTKYEKRTGKDGSIPYAEAKGKLEQEGFTPEEIECALKANGLSQIALALREAIRWIKENKEDLQRKTPRALERRLQVQGFSEEQIDYAMKNLDWRVLGKRYLMTWLAKANRRPAIALRGLIAQGYDYPDAYNAVVDCSAIWGKTEDDVRKELDEV